MRKPVSLATSGRSKVPVELSAADWKLVRMLLMSDKDSFELHETEGQQLARAIGAIERALDRTTARWRLNNC